jgi:predicted RNase H-like nuclease (RuvC/YqgF family)
MTKMGSTQSEIGQITPSQDINKVLDDNRELKEKYYNIKIKRKSYKNRIKMLENKVEKLINKVGELEIHNRQQYIRQKRGSNTSDFLLNRIETLEKKLQNTIILQPQNNNISFCSKK